MNLNVYLPFLFSFVFLFSCTKGTQFGQSPGKNPPLELSENISDEFSIKTNNTTQSSEIDILFVIDNSGSMSEEQAVLTQSFSRFIDKFRLRNIDYQIGVITTDADHMGDLYKDASHNNYIIHPGINDINNKFALNSTISPGLNPREEGLLSITEALNVNNALRSQSPLNLGLFRNNADLAIILISDEDESISQQTYATNTPQNVDQLIEDKLRNFTQTVNSHVSKHNKKLFYYTITNKADNQVLLRSIEELNKLNHKQTQNIDLAEERDFSNDIISLGESISQTVAESTYTLSKKPDVSTLQVYVDNSFVNSNDYQYNSISNSIKFNFYVINNKNLVEVKYKKAK